MCKRNCCGAKPTPQGLPLISSWSLLALASLTMVLWALPSHAQLKTRSEVGPSFGIGCSDSNGLGCGRPPLVGDTPPLSKPAAADDEKCLPWYVPAKQASTVNAKTPAVPSKARGDYQRACDVYHKKKFEEAEQDLRRAIDKYEDYSAAWVLLGVVLDEQHKDRDAHNACFHAVTIDGKYLPAHLCAAEFAARNQEWDRLLDQANAALGLNSENDGYAYYYQAMAYLYLNKPADAQKSALRAAEIDAKRSYFPLYFLLAQIYDAEGDKSAAVNQLKQALDRHNGSPEQEDRAKRYLAKLEAQPAAALVPKPPASNQSADAAALSEGSADEAMDAIPESSAAGESWIPEDIDRAVPPVASGTACSLPVVLKGAGQRIVELVHSVDRFTATEILEHRPVDHLGHAGPSITAKFNYLVSYTEGRTGDLQVDEFRNGSLSREPFPSHIATIGTPSLVLIFHPRYAGNFKIECEGLGDWHGQPAWQVRFEQRADRPNQTYSFTVNRVTYNVNLRGRAWILADSFQVARLETDLEQSIPEIRLRMDHQSVEYRPVESPATHARLWLPSSTELYMDFQGRRFYRKHSFTDFQLFSVETQSHVTGPKQTPKDGGSAEGASDTR